MASGHSNNRHGAPSMVRRNTGSDDYSPPPPINRNNPKPTRTTSYTRQDSNDPEMKTMELVNDFKRAIQNKARHGKPLSDADVELEVANIRRSANPDQCNFDRWKRNLPRDIENCSNTVLNASMAYGNDPREVQSIIKMKMNPTNSDEDPTNTSLDNIIDPLRRLKKELDKNKSSNLFRDIRNFDDRNIERANRLFLTEARHFARGAKDFSYTDAESAVKAIRETDYEPDNPDFLLPIIKTLSGTDDIRDYINNASQKDKKRDESLSRRSISSDDDHAPPSPSITNSSTSNKNTLNNDTSTFHIKPLDNPFASQPSIGPTSRRFHNRSEDEPTRSPPRHRPPRQ